MVRETDAIVIGAGLAGSSMAFALANEGWDVVLLDKDKFPRHKACGEFLSPESLATLRSLGLDKTVQALEPAVITQVRIHTERGASLQIPLPGPAWGVSRHALDAELQTAAKEHGVTVFTGSPVSMIAEDGDGYRVELGGKRGGDRFRSRIVIGAWGRQPFPETRTSRSEVNAAKSYVGIKSHYTARAEDSPFVDLYFFRGGYVGIAPVEGKRFNVAALLTSHALRNLGSSAAIQRIVDMAARNVPVIGERLKGAEPIAGTQAAVYPVKVRRVPRAWNGFPCVGDAIAVIPPFCGDGMSMALRSVELCAPLADACLKGNCTLEEWRQSYSRLVRQQFSGALRWGGMLERAMTHSVFSSWLLRFGMLAPKAAEFAVRATRLKTKGEWG
ncbi:NAD(P)/FAD-dependent oxidoreductase [Cohnella candidum]|nr:NAD(P)/FAD-dependent oxidoreductase [Cohnella candidum]